MLSRFSKIVLLFFVGCVEANYNYASDEARNVCTNICPGNQCPCILGENLTWYISPEVGEE